MVKERKETKHRLHYNINEAEMLLERTQIQMIGYGYGLFFALAIQEACITCLGSSCRLLVSGRKLHFAQSFFYF